MSSQDVRTAINAAVTTAAAPLPVFDLSDYVSEDEVFKQINSEAVVVQYVTSDEQMSTIGNYGNQGYRQTGTVVLHLVVPTGFDSDPAVTKGDSIREELRGQRLTAQLTVESVSPFTDFGGGAIGLTGGAWKGWASNLFYERHDCG